MKASYQVVPEYVIGYNLADGSWNLVTLPDSNFGVFMQQYHILEIGIVDVMSTEYTFLPYLHTEDLINWTGSLQEWFDSIAGVALTTLIPEFPTLSFTSAFWQPVAYNKEVQFTLTPPNTHPTQDFALDDASDYVIQTPEDQHSKYAHDVLYSVDGLWVSHKFEPYGVRLAGGGDIAKCGGTGNIGALVFSDIGAVKTHQFTDGEVVRVDVDRSLYTSLLIKTPVSITGKSVGVVVAGHLTWVKAEDYLSDTTVQFSMTNVNILERLLETQYKYDWSFLGLDDLSSPTHTARINSDDTLKKILNHVSTFLVIIDHPYLEHDNLPIGRHGAIGRYHYDDVKHELNLGYLTNQVGYGVEYWPVWDKGIWTFYTGEYSKPNYLYKSAKWRKQNLINDAQQHQQPWVAPSITMNFIKARKIK